MSFSFMGNRFASPRPIKDSDGDLRRRIGLTFWVQRPRYWTLERVVKTLVGRELLAPEAGVVRAGGAGEAGDEAIRAEALNFQCPKIRMQERFSSATSVF